MDNGSRETETKYEKETLEAKDIVTLMKTALEGLGSLKKQKIESVSLKTGSRIVSNSNAKRINMNVYTIFSRI